MSDNLVSLDCLWNHVQAFKVEAARSDSISPVVLRERVWPRCTGLLERINKVIVLFISTNNKLSQWSY